MKILLIGAGRRYSFVKWLQKSGFEVHSIEIEKCTPISKICTTHIDANSTCNNYKKNIKYLQKIIDKIKPDIVLSLNDLWSFLISQNKISNSLIISSQKLAAKISFDKKSLEDFILSKIPEIYPLPNEETQKFVFKPINGNGSKDVFFLKNQNSKKYKKLENSNYYIKQSFIKGLEYSADFYFDKYGSLINGVVRSRDKVSNGEVIESSIADKNISDKIKNIIAKISRLSGNQFIGPKCFQFIVENKTNKIFLIEINDRFGGGCLLSLKSGFDMVKILIEEYIQNKSLYDWLDFEPKKIVMKRVNYEVYF